MCFKKASCQHAVLAGMVVDESIKIPIQYDCITLQSGRKRRRPAKNLVKLVLKTREGAIYSPGPKRVSSKVIRFHRYTCTWDMH